MEHVLGTSYVDKYYTTFSGGSPRHICRTLDFSPSAEKYHSLACQWYDMLKPDISDPFYIACNSDSCVLHLDHSESMGWPVMIVVELPDDCSRDLLDDVLAAVTRMKKYLFHHWMHNVTANYARISNTALSVHTVCNDIAPDDYTVVLHSRTLGTYAHTAFPEMIDLDYTVRGHVRLQQELKDWASMCSTHSISDLRDMPRH